MTGDNVAFLQLRSMDRMLHDKLEKSGKTPTGSHSNVLLILKFDPLLKDIVSCDEFSLDYRVERAVPVVDDDLLPAPGPYPRLMAEGDIIRVLAYIQKFYAPKCALATVRECLLVTAQGNGFHPVRSWLDGLQWDGKPRIDQFLSQVYAAPLDDYHRAVGSKFLIAAVRRVRQPGCKFDYMLVLEGAQGIGKSTSFPILFGQDWFTDQIDSLSKKESAMDLRGKWCAEFSEIEHLIKSDIETVKAFLSRGVDHYRGPWMKASADYPRQCVLVGTTNAKDYLRDSTGNRRIWPVTCRSEGRVDQDWLRDNRDQLWAEAAHRETAGEPIWLSDESVRASAETRQKERLYEDPWAGKVLHYLMGKHLITSTSELLSEALQLSTQYHSKPNSDRVAAILRANGWENLSRWDRDQKRSVRRWYSPHALIQQNFDLCEGVREA